MSEKINDIQIINTKITDYLSQIVQLKKDLDKLQKEKDELNNQVKNLTEDNSKLKKEKEELKEQLKKLKK